MKHHTPSGLSAATRAALLLTPLLLGAGITGCVADRGYAGSYAGAPTGRVAASVNYSDDYVYYPAHETYYSRNRHEYVYRDGTSWVRRPQPAGISADVLIRTPSVRLDFHDSPESHHDVIIKKYPRTWRPDRDHNGIDDRLENRD